MQSKIYSFIKTMNKSRVILTFLAMWYVCFGYFWEKSVWYYIRPSSPSVFVLYDRHVVYSAYLKMLNLEIRLARVTHSHNILKLLILKRVYNPIFQIIKFISCLVCLFFFIISMDTNTITTPTSIFLIMYYFFRFSNTDI